MTLTHRHSRYLDGTIPGGRNPRIHPSEEAVYIQPDIDVADVGEGAEVDDEKKSICQRSGGDFELGIADWLKRNRNTIITVAAIYGGYRFLRR